MTPVIASNVIASAAKQSPMSKANPTDMSLRGAQATRNTEAEGRQGDSHREASPKDSPSFGEQSPMRNVDNLITQNLDIWTSAIKAKSTAGRGSKGKRELYGIKKLRELILELAISGLLCEPKGSGGWQSVDIGSLIAKKLKTINPEEKDHSLVELWSVPAFSSKKPELIKKSQLGSSKKELPEYAVLLSKINPHLNRVWKVDKVSDYPLVSSPEWITLEPGPCWDRDYLVLTLMAPEFNRELCSTAQGMGSLTRANVKQVSSLKISRPPKEVQVLIRRKVYELMYLCDQLEQQTETSLSAHKTLVETLLCVLINAPTHDEFQAAWQRIAQHFDTLFTTEHSIDQLKKTILQLAVMGKLVPQDPNDEPASELLKKIAAEKARLVKEGKIKKQKPLPPIGEDEKQFELPKRWEWCRLQDLVSVLGDGLHGTPEYDESGSYYFVNGNNLSDGVIEIKPGTKKVNQVEFEKYKKKLNENTVLVSINGTLGNVAFYNQEPVILGKSACYMNLCISLSKMFFKRCFESPYFLEYASENATGSTIKNLGLKAMNNFPVPLPSEEEQCCIVAKIDELMVLCDQLKARQTEAQTTQLHLADAIVERAVA